MLIWVYAWAIYTWGLVLWVVVQNKPMIYEHEDVANAIVIRNGLMQKNLYTFEFTNRD